MSIVIEPTILAAIIAAVVAITNGVILAIVRRRWQKKDKRDDCIEATNKEIADMRKSIWRLNKTVLIMAKIIDDQTVKNHPELIAGLEDIAKELLDTDSA